MNLTAALRARNTVEEQTLARLTTMRVGGPVTLVHLQSLVDLAELRERGSRYLGKGANIIAGDHPADVPVVRLGSAFQQLHIQPSAQGAVVEVGAAYDLAGLVKRTAEADLSGLEALAGVPATVGGALWMNAGTAHGWIGDAVEAVHIVLPDQQAATWWDRAEYGPVYRGSALPAGTLILGARLRVQQAPAGEALARVRALKQAKANSQPLAAYSAGCVFKNPAPDTPAGRLIDQCGCKGWREGAAVVSERHANFIVNEGEASGSAVFTLIRRIRQHVWRERGMVLEVETRVWDGPEAIHAHPGEDQIC